MQSVLLVEKQASPSDRAVRVLARAFPEMTLIRAHDTHAIREALAHGDVAVIVSQPVFDDGEIGDSVRLGGDEIPIVALSRTGAEPATLEAVEAGITALVIDSDEGIARLPVVLRGLLAKRRAPRPGRSAGDAFFTLTHEMLATLDREGRFVETNPALGLTLGYRSEDLAGKTLFGLAHEEDRASLEHRWQSAVSTGNSGHLELRMTRGDGRPAQVVWALTVMPGTGLVYATGRDISARACREREAESRAAKLDAFFESSPEAAFFAATDGLIQGFNRAAESLFGRSRAEILGVRFNTLFRESDFDDLEPLLETIRAGGRELMLTARTRNDQSLPVRVRLRAERIDETETVVGMVLPAGPAGKRQRDEELRRFRHYRIQQRETTSALISGIAHDFSNLLAPMIGYTEIALSDLPPGSPAEESLEQVLEATGRARALIDTIYRTSRHTLELRPVDIAKTIGKTLDLIEAMAAPGIHLRTRLTPLGNARVAVEEPMISLLILELVENAIEAIGVGQGNVEISVDRVRLESADLVDLEQLREGEHALIRVCDSGPGMSEDARNRAFMPFFTTKSEGHAGIGLTVVNKIARKLSGQAVIKTGKQGGTVASVYLPLQTAAPATEPARLRVMVVDDEPEVTAMLDALLRRHKCEVTIGNGGLDALEHFSRDPDHFDLIITDQRMPDMTGTRLAERLTGRRPDLPVILLSGFAGEDPGTIPTAAGVSRFLAKPFSNKALLDTISAVTGWLDPARADTLRPTER